MMKTVGRIAVIWILIRVVVWVVLGYLLLTGAIAYFVNPDAAPSPADAPWVIQTYSTDGTATPSRVYYAETVTSDSGAVTIDNYWTFDGKRYKHVKEEKAFPEEIYGNITITRRVR